MRTDVLFVLTPDRNFPVILGRIFSQIHAEKSDVGGVSCNISVMRALKCLFET